MNKVPILFTSKTCGACINQLELIKKHFKSNNNAFINIIDVDKHNVPFIQYTPTWYIPNKNGGYSVYDSVISNPKDFDKLVTKGSAFGKKRKLRKSRKTRFGENNGPSYLPQLGTWEKYGKNFPDKDGFNIPPSFSNKIEKTWGKDALISGTLGRDQGPGNFNNVLTNGYLNDIRMAQPNDQLGTELYLNRTCNINRNVSTNAASPGMIFNSPNPQIVSMNTGFGKRSKFGDSFLYRQMGKAYGTQYIKEPDTVKKLYGGALTDNLPRPNKVQNKNEFIGQAPPYNPLNNFGKKDKVKVKAKKVKVKAKKVKVCVTKKSIKDKLKKSIKKCIIVGEGSILTVKGNKIKVKKAK
jgi:hypothetical protein